MSFSVLKHITSADLGVNYWEPDIYSSNPQFSLVSLGQIRSHVGRQYLKLDGRRVWGTITLDPVRENFHHICLSTNSNGWDGRGI
jgi:hypothetical protein